MQMASSNTCILNAAEWVAWNSYTYIYCFAYMCSSEHIWAHIQLNCYTWLSAKEMSDWATLRAEMWCLRWLHTDVSRVGSCMQPVMLLSSTIGALISSYHRYATKLHSELLSHAVSSGNVPTDKWKNNFSQSVRNFEFAQSGWMDGWICESIIFDFVCIYLHPRKNRGIKRPTDSLCNALCWIGSLNFSPIRIYSTQHTHTHTVRQRYELFGVGDYIIYT